MHIHHKALTVILLLMIKAPFNTLVKPIKPLIPITTKNFINLLLILILLTMRLDIIHHNVRHWGHHKNDLSNYYLRHNPGII